MNSELALIKRIEAYLYQEMSDEEMMQFEQERAEQPDLDSKVIAHLDFLKSLKGYGEVQELKSSMDSFHNELDIVSLKEELQEKESAFVLYFRKYQRNFAVAASVAILATLITLISTGQFRKSGNSSTYNALKRDMESIKKSQNALIRNINSKSPNKEIAPSQFGGTGFALSSNGYLVTNYHVVQGADSVYIQNNKGESFKVQTIYIDPSYDIALLQIVDPLFKSL